MRRFAYAKFTKMNFALVISWTLIIASAFFLRPVQDDYLVLSALSQDSLLNFLQSVWQNQGGNIWPYFVNGVLLTPATYSTNFLGLTFFYIITIVCVLVSTRILIDSILGQDLKITLGNTYVFFPILVLVAFEGLFVPTYAGAFSFSLASIAHLWPVILSIFAWRLLNSYRNLWFLLFPLGLIIGNSNAGESFTAFLLISWLILGKIIGKINLRLRYSSLVSLWVGVTSGLTIMFIAPGFSNRANNSVGFPESLSELVFRFFKAFVSLPVESLTHPGAYLVFFLGLVFSNKILVNVPLKSFSGRVKALVLCYLLLLLNLVGGGTLAYVSWHQSFGLNLLLPSLFFLLGVQAGQVSGIKFKNQARRVLPIVIVLVLVVFGRGLGTLIERGIEWDRTLVINSCNIKTNSEDNLLGAELRYPPFKFGFEDIQTWPWMLDSYKIWIQEIRPKKPISCG